jgi:hypothetical protein
LPGFGYLTGFCPSSLFFATKDVSHSRLKKLRLKFSVIEYQDLRSKKEMGGDVNFGYMPIARS